MVLQVITVIHKSVVLVTVLSADMQQAECTLNAVERPATIIRPTCAVEDSTSPRKSEENMLRAAGRRATTATHKSVVLVTVLSADMLQVECTRNAVERPATIIRPTCAVEDNTSPRKSEENMLRAVGKPATTVIHKFVVLITVLSADMQQGECTPSAVERPATVIRPTYAVEDNTSPRKSEENMLRAVGRPATTGTHKSVVLITVLSADMQQEECTPSAVERPATIFRHTCAVEDNTSPRKSEENMLRAVGRQATTKTHKSVVLITVLSADMQQEECTPSAVERPATIIRPTCAVEDNTSPRKSEENMLRAVGRPATTGTHKSVALVTVLSADMLQEECTPSAAERPATIIRHTCAVEDNTSPRKSEENMLRAVGRPATTGTHKSVALVTVLSADMLQEECTPSAAERPATIIRHTCAVEDNTSPRKSEENMLRAVGRPATTGTHKSVVLTSKLFPGTS